MDMTQMAWFLLIGLGAGWLAAVIVKGHGFGVLGNLIVGAIGAVVGGWLFAAIGLEAYGKLGSLIMALVGAVIFLGTLYLLKRTYREIHWPW